MRIQALLLLCCVMAVLCGIALFWSAPSGRIGLWLQGLFLMSAFLTLVFSLVLLVSAARRSIDSSITAHFDHTRTRQSNDE